MINQNLKFYYLITALLLIFISGHYVHAASSPDFILAWTADTYAPSSYQGKNLPVSDSFIKVTAIPTFSLPMDIKTLNFNWFIDGNFSRDASGYGKSILNFQNYKNANSYYEIKLRILYSDSRLLAEKTITIKTVKPEIIFQNAEEPMNGLNIINPDQALYMSSNKTFSLMALPLFFNIRNISDLNFTWQFDNQTFEDPAKKNQNIFNIVVGKVSAIVEKTLNLTVTNKNSQFEKNNATLNIILTPFSSDL